VPNRVLIIGIPIKEKFVKQRPKRVSLPLLLFPDIMYIECPNTNCKAHTINDINRIYAQFIRVSVDNATDVIDINIKQGSKIFTMNFDS